MSMQSETWSRDELILCLYLYIAHKQTVHYENRVRQQDRAELLRFYFLQKDIAANCSSNSWTHEWLQTSMFPELEQPFLCLPEQSNPIDSDHTPQYILDLIGTSIVKDIIHLTGVLNRLNGYEQGLSKIFRTPNCVSRKLCDFRGVDPNHYHWAVKTDTLDVQPVWNEFSQNLKRLERIAVLLESTSGKIVLSEADDNGNAYPEGKLLFKLHTSRERNRELVKKKKYQALKEFGVLRCEACDFVFSQKYGPLGNDFIECHHTIPISTLPVDGKTHIRDLALVCSNCHRMLHRQGELLTVSRLRSIILAEGSEEHNEPPLLQGHRLALY